MRYKPPDCKLPTVLQQGSEALIPNTVEVPLAETRQEKDARSNLCEFELNLLELSF